MRFVIGTLHNVNILALNDL